MCGKPSLFWYMEFLCCESSVEETMYSEDYFFLQKEIINVYHLIIYYMYCMRVCTYVCMYVLNFATI